MAQVFRRSEGNVAAGWWIALTAAIFAVGAILFGVAAHSGGSNGYDGMMGGYAGSSWMWVFGAMLMVLAVPLVILLVVLFAPAVQPQGGIDLPPTPDPSTVLRLRLARGEIAPEEYRRLLAELGAAPRSGPRVTSAP